MTLEVVMEWVWLGAVVFVVIGSIGWRYKSEEIIAMAIKEREKTGE